MAYAPYKCILQPNPRFGPAVNLITAITNANPAQVTTQTVNNYVNQMVVKLYVPPACGMDGVSGLQGAITVVDPYNFLIDIDTTMFTAFAIPGSPNPRADICAQTIPVGDVSNTFQGVVHNLTGPQQPA
jgi:hypothetical protein